MKKPYLTDTDLGHACLDLVWYETISTQNGNVAFEISYNGFLFYASVYEGKRMMQIGKDARMDGAITLALLHLGVPKNERDAVIPKICAGFFEAYKSLKIPE